MSSSLANFDERVLQDLSTIFRYLDGDDEPGEFISDETENTDLLKKAHESYQSVESKASEADFDVDFSAILDGDPVNWAILELATDPDPSSMQEIAAETSYSQATVQKRFRNFRSANLMQELGTEEVKKRGYHGKTKLHQGNEVTIELLNFGNQVASTLESNSDKNSYPSDEAVYQKFHALGNEYNPEIIEYIRVNGPQTAQSLSDNLDIPIATLYRRLNTMEDSGVIAEFSEKDHINYSTAYDLSLDEEDVEEMIGKLKFLAAGNPSIPDEYNGWR